MFLRFHIISLLVLCFMIHGAWASDENNLQFDQPQVLKTLQSAVEKFDELKTVPNKSWFGTDKSDVSEEINEFLDDVIAILDIPELVRLRQDYRKVEQAIIERQDKIAHLREGRLLAPEGDPTFTTKLTPTMMLREWTAKTRGDYDLLIDSHQNMIDSYQAELKNIETKMSELLSSIGVTLEPDQIEFWLSSVIGDDVLSMSVVFSNIKVVAGQLGDLTEESGENLTYAKRYYGMLVMLHQLVVNMQENFISKTDNDILPKLAGFSRDADQNISEAKRLIRDGGNRSHLESNIAANELTKDAIELYQKIVTSHRNKVSQALKISDRERQVAINTYKTVRLSSDVSNLIREGLSTFETLSNLHIPAAAEFQNAEIREEFRKLTEKLKND